MKIILLLVASSVHAATFTYPTSVSCNPAQLTAELAAAGVLVDSVGCGPKQTSVTTTAANSVSPSPTVAAHIPVDPFARSSHATLDAEIAGIMTRIDAGTQTPGDVRRLLKIILYLLGKNSGAPVAPGI